MSASPDIACSDDYWNNQTEWTTLVASTPLAVQCPFPGQYLVPTPQSSPTSRCGDMTKVTIGCHRGTAIQFVAHPDDADCSADLENAKPSTEIFCSIVKCGYGTDFPVYFSALHLPRPLDG